MNDKKENVKNSQFNEYLSVIKFHWWTVLKIALKVFFRFYVEKIWILFFLRDSFMIKESFQRLAVWFLLILKYSCSAI